MRTKIFTLLALFLVLSPRIVLAHAGHGTLDGTNLWHYLTSPLHLIYALIVLAVAVFGVRYFTKRQEN